ncbi:MAG: hypothetical protein RR706_09755 [Muribaculaceae bacterium]
MRTLTTHRQAKERRRRSTPPTPNSQLTSHRQAKERRRRSTSERQF